MSDFIRKRVLGIEPTRQKIVIKKHPVSGLRYNAGGAGLPIVTHEQIKAALADFP
jgi:hypothetical protein